MTFDKCELIGHDSKRTRPNLMVVSVAVPETFGVMLEADRWVHEILISPQKRPEKWRVHTLLSCSRQQLCHETKETSTCHSFSNSFAF